MRRDEVTEMGRGQVIKCFANYSKRFGLYFKFSRKPLDGCEQMCYMIYVSNFCAGCCRERGLEKTKDDSSLNWGGRKGNRSVEFIPR